MNTKSSQPATVEEPTKKPARQPAGPIRPLDPADYGGAPYVPVSRAAADSHIGEDTIRKRLSSKLKRVGRADFINTQTFNLEFFSEPGDSSHG